jgi:hypothetical protein
MSHWDAARLFIEGLFVAALAVAGYIAGGLIY